MLTWLEAQHVTAFDVDAGNLMRAQELVAETAMQSRATLVEGTGEVSLVDRTNAFTEFSSELLERTDTVLREALVDSLGAAGFDAFRKWCEVRYVDLRDGGLLQSHFRAHKPNHE